MSPGAPAPDSATGAAETPATRPSLRPLRSAHLQSALQIERQCFGSPWPPEAFTMAVHDDSILALGAFENGGLVGYVVACAGDGAALVANLAVARRRRRRGLGRRLLEAAVAWARRQDLRLVTLEVRRSNGAALQLYQEAGFESLGIRRGYYRDPPEDAVTMALFLDESGA